MIACTANGWRCGAITVFSLLAPVVIFFKLALLTEAGFISFPSHGIETRGALIDLFGTLIPSDPAPSQIVDLTMPLVVPAGEEFAHFANCVVRARGAGIRLDDLKRTSDVGRHASLFVVDRLQPDELSDLLFTSEVISAFDESSHKFGFAPHIPASFALNPISPN